MGNSAVRHAVRFPLSLFISQGTGQGVLRSVQSLAQIIGPLWATLSGNPDAFWGGMLGFTALSFSILIIFWKRLLPKPPPKLPGDSAPAADETTPLMGAHEAPMLEPMEGALPPVELVDNASDPYDVLLNGDVTRSRASSRYAIN